MILKVRALYTIPFSSLLLIKFQQERIHNKQIRSIYAQDIGEIKTFNPVQVILSLNLNVGLNSP